MKLLLTLYLGLIASVAYAQPNYPTDPAQAKLLYADLDNFLDGYQLLDELSDTVQVLEDSYFSKASAGLQEYMNRHSLSAEMLAKALGEYPEQYALLADFRKNIDATEERFEGELSTFGEVLPSAMYPPTYLLVGANRGIAQASAVGQLVTVERVADDQDKLMHLITHELTHFQQARALGFQQYAQTYNKPDNMLDLVLREGGAEFISYYLVEKGKQGYRNKSYYESREADLKSRFLSDLSKQEKRYWLWESLQQDGPTLIGYTMGYKICEAYYLNSEDKVQALQDILGIQDNEAFLHSSQYFSDTRRRKEK